MQYKDFVEPFQLLRKLDQKSRERSGGLPAYQDQGQGWTGVLFNIRGNELLAAMGEIVEIVPMESLTSIPATRPWLLGVMNLRGSLLPVIDLEGFLFEKNLPGTGLRSRLLVVNNDGYSVGLLVRAVQGMKHYRKDDASMESPQLDDEMKAYVSGGYERQQSHYAVFDINKLLANERFRQIAA